MVAVLWAAGSDDDRTTADRLLATLVAEQTAVSPSQVCLARLCPRCGSGSHGRPVVLSPMTAPLYVSVARSGGITVAALSRAGRVGVDVEQSDATAFHGFADVALHPEERDGPAADRAALWTRKEAVLKALGLGVGWGPERVRIGRADPESGRVDGLPIGSGSVAWTAVHLEPGYTAAVALVGREPPAVTVRRAAPGVAVR